MTHPALAIPFADLVSGLEAAVEARHVNRQISDDGLHIFSYSDSCTYDRAWTPVTRVARGLIIDPGAGRIVALPFPKFFNVGENADPLPALSFETFEKLDGSLIILFHYAGRWRTATRGSFQSEQAKWAEAELASHDLSALDPEVTYLAEAIYPQNRIVVHYEVEALFLLAANHRDGQELSYAELCEVSRQTGFNIARRFHYDNVAELLAQAKTLPPTEEGYVLRFENGHRVKIKGEEYMRIHRLVSHLTPLAVWESMMNGDDLEELRKQLPEEFWTDFDAIRATIEGQVSAIVEATAQEAAKVSALSDKDVGLRLQSFPANVRPFIFPYRKQHGELLSGRSRLALFRTIRPTGNRLDGYMPSYLLNRVMAETV